MTPPSSISAISLSAAFRRSAQRRSAGSSASRQGLAGVVCYVIQRIWTLTEVRSKAWCLLIHAEASLCLSRILTLDIQLHDVLDVASNILLARPSLSQLDAQLAEAHVGGGPRGAVARLRVVLPAVAAQAEIESKV